MFFEGLGLVILISNIFPSLHLLTSNLNLYWLQRVKSFFQAVAVYQTPWKFIAIFSNYGDNKWIINLTGNRAPNKYKSFPNPPGIQLIYLLYFLGLPVRIHCVYVICCCVHFGNIRGVSPSQSGKEVV